MARSSLSEMAEGTRFVKLIPATIAEPAEKIRRLVFCSGQVYYALMRAIEANKLSGIAVARIEQISPFPWDQFARECDRFPEASDIVWCQEEPMNLGPWSYVEPRMETALSQLSVKHAGKRAKFAGRRSTAAVATGYKWLHTAEEHDLLSMALFGSKKEPKTTQSGIAIW